jgi:MFS family permease
VGETIVAPTRNPLINSLADDRIRGRANSISGFSNSLMLIVSPAIVTSLLAAHLGAVWIALLCLGCLGTVAIASRLRVTLTAEQDSVTQPPVAESPPRAASKDIGSRDEARHLRSTNQN